MVFAPLEIRMAIDHGHASFKHEPLSIELPPGVLDMTFNPPQEELVWQYYLWTFGEVNPGGPTDQALFVHWQEGVKIHGDPFVHSLLDFEYPIWANSTMNNPHYIRLINRTGVLQTIDLQLWLAEFPNKAAYMNWYADLILAGLRNDIGKVLLTIMSVDKQEFEKILETRRNLVYRPLGPCPNDLERISAAAPKARRAL